MTRETRIGLLVSFSFLCLVGVVLYCKLREVDGPPADKVAQAAPVDPVPLGQVPLPPLPKAEPLTKDAGVVPAAASTPPPAPARPIMEPQTTPIPPPVPATSTAPAPPGTSSEVARPMPQGPSSAANDTNKSATAGMTAENPAPIFTTVPGSSGPSSVPAPPVLADKGGTPESPTGSGKPPGEAPANARVPPNSPATLNPSPISLPGPLSSDSTAPLRSNDGMSRPGSFERPLPSKSANPGGLNPIVPPPNLGEPQGGASEASRLVAPAPESSPGILAPPPADLRRPVLGDSSSGAAPPAASSPAEPAQTIHLQPPVNQSPSSMVVQPSTEGNRRLERLAPPATASPYAGRDSLTAAPAPLPIKPVSDVESYDEESHVCRSNDTPENLSQEYYHTPRYARALVFFNRDHPRAGDGIKQEPPLLAAGQVLYVPPARVLEKNYGTAIGENPSPAAIGALTPPPVSTPAAPSASGVRLYPVRQKNGEMLYQIAQRTLGTGDRWYEIALLNPQFKPEQPVPFGQQLRLPGDARIDQADTP